MHRELKKIIAAFIQFSRLPIRANTLDQQLFDQSTTYLPLVGLVIGCIGALAFYLTNIYFDATIAAIASITITCAVTGAIHEDGFADCCDGLFGGYTPQKRLQIMKDSRVGTFGVMGLILLTLLKVQLISGLLEHTVIALITAHVLARIVPLWIMRLSEYVRSSVNTESDKGTNTEATNKDTYTAKMTNTIATQPIFASRVTIVALVIALILFSTPLVATMLAILTASTLLLNLLFRQKLGGYNGDCLGASEQVGEVIVLMIFAAY
ncbi:Adenosylcobinamide-GDP ribazoletransferase [BD1-7 clade bacterium]|nr:Adenosylcobinamide-GDP ribazoletransferase [BD1-7 clade bacterium]